MNSFVFYKEHLTSDKSLQNFVQLAMTMTMIKFVTLGPRNTCNDNSKKCGIDGKLNIADSHDESINSLTVVSRNKAKNSSKYSPRITAKKAILNDTLPPTRSLTSISRPRPSVPRR